MYQDDFGFVSDDDDEDEDLEDDAADEVGDSVVLRTEDAPNGDRDGEDEDGKWFTPRPVEEDRRGACSPVLPTPI